METILSLLWMSQRESEVPQVGSLLIPKSTQIYFYDWCLPIQFHTSSVDCLSHVGRPDRSELFARSLNRCSPTTRRAAAASYSWDGHRTVGPAAAALGSKWRRQLPDDGGCNICSWLILSIMQNVCIYVLKHVISSPCHPPTPLPPITIAFRRLWTHAVSIAVGRAAAAPRRRCAPPLHPFRDAGLSAGVTPSRWRSFMKASWRAFQQPMWLTKFRAFREDAEDVNKVTNVQCV